MLAALARLLEKLFAPPAPVAARRASVQEPELRGKKPRSPAELKAREEMIRAAMAIQKDKQHVFDQLDPATREKLTTEAFQKLGKIQSITQNQSAKGKR
jgi:hypothetical protein